MLDDLRLNPLGRAVKAQLKFWGHRIRLGSTNAFLVRGIVIVFILCLVTGFFAMAWQLHQAQKSKELSEIRLAEVRSLIPKLVFGFTESRNSHSLMASQRADLLMRSLDVLESLQRVGDADEVVLAEIASVHVRLADIYATEASLERNLKLARKHSEKAVALVERVWTNRKSHAAFQGYASRAYSVMAEVESQSGNREKAAAMRSRGLELATQALAAAPDGVQSLLRRSEVSSAYQALAVALDDNGIGLGRHEEAMAMYQAARESRLEEMTRTAEIEMLDAELEYGQHRYKTLLYQSLSSTLTNVSSSLLRHGQYEKAVVAARESVGYIRQAKAAHPRDFHLELVAALRQLAKSELQMGNTGASLTAAQENMELEKIGAVTAHFRHEFLYDDFELCKLAMAAALNQLGRPADTATLLQTSVSYWRTRFAKDGRSHVEQSMLEAEFRSKHAEALLRGAHAADKWQSVVSTAERLGTSSIANPKNADVWLLRAEAESGIAINGPTALRRQWGHNACNTWTEAAKLRNLSPVALPLQGTTCTAAKADGL